MNEWPSPFFAAVPIICRMRVRLGVEARASVPCKELPSKRCAPDNPVAPSTPASAEGLTLTPEAWVLSPAVTKLRCACVRYLEAEIRQRLRRNRGNTLTKKVHRHPARSRAKTTRPLLLNQAASAHMLWCAVERSMRETPGKDTGDEMAHLV